ncbi:MAG: nucleotidyltransferase domain-containing protein [Chloroflexi bacterium]|nr:nucleotidyltransferase domain-containing protein [Chloroflexota bacterium]
MRQSLNVVYRLAAEEFTRRVLSSLRDQIEAIVLYGSTARGEAKRFSDIDILVISPDPPAVKDQISEIRSDLTYERNFSFLISLIHLSPEEFGEQMRQGSPLIDDVIAQGVILYDRGTFSRIREEATAVGR